MRPATTFAVTERMGSSRRWPILFMAALLSSLSVSADAAAPPPAPPWTVAQATKALLHPVRIVSGPTVSKTGTIYAMVSTYGYAHNPDGEWDLAGNMAKSRGSQFFDTKAATCRGLGRPKRGRYSGFTCDLTIGISDWPDIRTATYWIRPWTSTKVCVSDRALAACPPATPVKPLPGDPRDCKNVPGNSSGDAAFCTIRAAEYAGRNAFRAANDPVILFGCLATTVFSYRCTEGGTTTVPLKVAIVTFTPGKTAWKTAAVVQ